MHLQYSVSVFVVIIFITNVIRKSRNLMVPSSSFPLIATYCLLQHIASILNLIFESGVDEIWCTDSLEPGFAYATYFFLLKSDKVILGKISHKH